MAAQSPLDDAFDEAFRHLADCRATWEDDPRNPALLEALGRARAALEDARTAMREERIRLGLEAEPPRRGADDPHVDADPRSDWQGIHPN